MDSQPKTNSKESLSNYRDSLLSSSTYLGPGTGDNLTPNPAPSNVINPGQNRKRGRSDSGEVSSQNNNRSRSTSRGRRRHRSGFRRFLDVLHRASTSRKRDKSTKNSKTKKSRKKRKRSSSSTHSEPRLQVMSTDESRHVHVDTTPIILQSRPNSRECSWSDHPRFNVSPLASCYSSHCSSILPFEAERPPVPNFDYTSPSPSKPYILNEARGECFNNNNDYEMNNSDYLSAGEPNVDQSRPRSQASSTGQVDLDAMVMNDTGAGMGRNIEDGLSEEDDSMDEDGLESRRSRSHVSLRALRDQLRGIFGTSHHNLSRN